MARLLTYNYLINKYIFNNQICKYNNHISETKKIFTFNTTNDVKNFIHYFHFNNHDFGDLSLADKIIINDSSYNETWLIAGFNTQLDSDVKNGTFGKHHLTLIPEYYLLNNVRNHNRNDNSQGFAGTEMFNITLPEINNNLSNVLDKYLLPHKLMLSVDNKDAKQFFTVKSMLLNYYQAYGIDLPYSNYDSRFTKYIGVLNKYINNHFHHEDMFQMPLFKQYVKYRTVSNCCWLRDSFGSDAFATISYRGFASFADATNTIEICCRPFICLG